MRSRTLLVIAAGVLGLLAPESAAASFPGTNGKVAFARSGVGEILTVNPDGTGEVNLTDSPAIEEFQPAFSPDGTRIAFNRGSGSADIWAMNANGSASVQITDDPAHDFNPSYSPDGSKIVFARTVAYPNIEIYVINADGTGEQRLTNHGAFDVAPTFSPDGSTIAFQSDRSGTHEIWVMNADGSQPRQLTTGGGASPDFSPDGTRIAFVRDDEIQVMSATGGPAIGLTNDAVENGKPAFSPDGSKVAYERGFGAIYVRNADGSGAEAPLIVTEAVQPSWQPLRPPPSNLFSFGKLKRNVERGTATLEVIAPGPGQLTLARTGKLKSASKQAAGKVRLKIAPRGKAKRQLVRSGVLRAKASVTYLPSGGVANTQAKKVKLIRRGE